MMKRLTTILTILIVLSATMTTASATAPPELATKATTHATFHYPTRYEPAAAKLAAMTDKTMQNVAQSLGRDALDPVDVWLVPKVNDYFKWNGLSGRAPEWAIGLSLSKKNTIIVVNGTGPGGKHVDLEKTFIHELTHVAIDQARGDAVVPRWFHEGFATMVADEWETEKSEAVTQAASFGGLLPFESITRTFPPHQMRASLAYGQSFHFVRWGQTHYSPDIYAKLFKQLPEKNFNDAYKNATGESVKLAEAKWKTQLEKGSSPFAFFRDSGIVLFGASLLFVVAWLIRRKRTKRRLAAMDDEERTVTYDPNRYPLPRPEA